MSDLTEFAEQLQNSVTDEARLGAGGGGRGGDGTEDFKENAFTRIVLEDLDEAGAVESPVCCHFEAGTTQPVKINAYSLPEDEQRLILVVTDYCIAGDGGFQTINAAETDKTFKPAERFLQLLGDPRHRFDVNPAHEAYGMIRAISSRLDTIRNVQIILITNRKLAVRREKQRPRTVRHFQLSHDIWDLERIFRFRSAGVAHDPVELDFSHLPGGGLACLSNDDPDLGYSTTLALVPGRVLADLYEEYGARLLELNVRSYLQARGKINRGILETLCKTQERFLAYNNGITIVAEDISLTPDQTRIAKITGLQVVNGGQTTASIHRAFKENRADISHVYVQAKITKVPLASFDEVVPEISKYSNTQNKVNEVDLRANHPFHIGVERFAAKKWAPGERSKWFYERARGSYQTARARAPRGARIFDTEFPAEQRLTKEDLARYFNVFDGLPHVSSRGGQKSFLKFMEGIGKLPKDWEPSEAEFKEIVGKTILFRASHEIARAIGLSAYRINIVSYAVALLMYKTGQTIDFGRVWELQDIAPHWKQWLTEYLPEVKGLLDRGVKRQKPGGVVQNGELLGLHQASGQRLAP